jgi:hypothetical protein
MNAPVHLPSTLQGSYDFEEFSLVAETDYVWQPRAEADVRQIVADLQANPTYIDGEPKPKITKIIKRRVTITVTEWEDVEVL